MLLKSEVLTAVHGAQGYHPAYTYTPSYRPKPAVHGIFLIGKFMMRLDVAYSLITEWKKMITVLIQVTAYIKSVARNSSRWWRRHK